MSACDVCGACPCYEHERKTIIPPPVVVAMTGTPRRVETRREAMLRVSREYYASTTPRAPVWQQIEGREKRRPCCMRRARARYWRLVRGYVGLGMALGVALGMVLGALAVRP